MDQEARDRFDEGYAIARDAIGLPQSRSLFDMLDTPAGGPDDEIEKEEEEQQGANDTEEVPVAAE